MQELEDRLPPETSRSSDLPKVQQLQQLNRISVVSSLAGLKAAEGEIDWSTNSFETFIAILNNMDKAKRLVVDGHSSEGPPGEALRRLLDLARQSASADGMDTNAVIMDSLKVPDEISVSDIGSALAVRIPAWLCFHTNCGGCDSIKKFAIGNGLTTFPLVLVGVNGFYH